MTDSLLQELQRTIKRSREIRERSQRARDNAEELITRTERLLSNLKTGGQARQPNLSRTRRHTTRVIV